jgi:hypothetical protein
MQRRVHRSLAQPEHPGASLLDALDDPVAVTRLAFQRRQDQQVEMASQYLATQSIVSLGIAGADVKRPDSPTLRALLPRADLVLAKLLAAKQMVAPRLEGELFTLQLAVARPAIRGQ